jgi:enoyl-CoA hydratase/carnithine racemase
MGIARSTHRYALHRSVIESLSKTSAAGLGRRGDDVGYCSKTRQRQPLPPVMPEDCIMPGHLIVTDEDATRMIKLRRPEKKNAITQEMYRAMSEAIDTAQNNPAIRCMVITGGSGAFTAGNDLEDFLKDGTSNADTPRASNATKFLYSLAHNVKPLIAAVDGIAIGIGTTMLFHCDYVVASTIATFSTPFIHLGLVPEGASSLLMPRTMGYQRAFAMLVMGRPVSADDARVAGFVNAVVSPGHTEAEARKVAREICELPAEAVAISRKLLRPPSEDLTRRIDQESHLFGERMRSREAVAAFKAFFARKKV